MRTTVLLLSVDEAPMLERSLPAAVSQEGADVVVVDNACTDATAELAERHGARLIPLAGPGGVLPSRQLLPSSAHTPSTRRSYAAAMNEAIARTGGDAVLLLNADCFLKPGFLAAARPRLEEPRVCSVAPKLLRVENDGEIDAAGMGIDRRRKNGLVGHGRPASAFSRSAEAFGADGAAALYRREALEACAIEGEVLDEDMALWATDADLAWRVRLLGWRCVYEPRAVARHVRTYSPSTRATVSEAHRRLQFCNRLLMVAKNETPRGLLQDLPHLALYETLALGHALLRERCLLGGYAEAARLLAGARRRRAVVQARRVVERPPFGLTPPDL